MRRLLILPLILLSAFAYASDSDGDGNGVYVQIQGGPGLTNSQIENSLNNTSFFTDAAIRATFGVKVDSYFGFEIAYDNSALTTAGGNSAVDIMLSYYMDLSRNWDMQFLFGPYYDFALSNVGIAGGVSFNYYLTNNTQLTLSDLVYINPSVSSNFNQVAPYLLSNQPLVGIKYTF